MRLEKELKLEQIVTGTQQRANFLVCIITLGMVPIEYHVASSRLQFPVNGRAQSMIVKKYEVGKARDLCVDHLLRLPEENRPEYMFFFGDDMIPEWDGLIRLYDEMVTGKWDVLTGLYYIKAEPPVPLTWRNDTIGWMMPGIHYKVGEVIDVDVTGMDFTLIRTSFLQKMAEQVERPFFKTGPGPFPYQSIEQIVTFTEDVYFLAKARKCGGKIGVHTGVKVGHYDIKSGMIY